jgi:hypothetical protein
MEKRLGIIQICLLLVALVFMALTRGSSANQHLRQERDRLRSWRNSDWSRWRRRSMSKSPLGDPPTITPSKPIRLSHSFGPPSPSLNNHHYTPGNLHSTSQSHTAYRSPKHSRTRVSSFPPLPPRNMPRSGSHPSPQSSSTRKVIPHLHEVKTEKLRRRIPVDLGADEPSDGEGTPRLVKTTLHMNGKPRTTPAKGKEKAHKDRPFTPEPIRNGPYPDDGREASPGSTAAGEMSEDSNAWEDTTTEGEDDVETEYIGLHD